MQEHLYIVAYDIHDEKRLRKIFKLMKGYGEWLQFSIFQCRLSARRHAELMSLLDGLIVNGQDHVVMLDLGPADAVKPRIVSLGKSFDPVAREPTIV
ncbi:MAG: CRISPR-associated endonuclease Cas2 [Solimonas sp.]